MAVADLDPALTETGAEGYVIEADARRVTVRAGAAIGATNALFRIADLIGAGHDWTEVDSDGPVTPRLAERFVDTGAVGVQPDPAAYRLQQDYQHASGALEKVVTSEAPYVDPAGLAAAQRDWRQFVDHAVAYGYNGVVIPGFLEYVNFDRLGDGHQVYAADSRYRARHQVMKREVAALSAVYQTVAKHPDGVDGAIAGGERAIATATAMREALAGVGPAAYRDPALGE